LRGALDDDLSVTPDLMRQVLDEWVLETWTEAALATKLGIDEEIIRATLKFARDAGDPRAIFGAHDDPPGCVSHSPGSSTASAPEVVAAGGEVDPKVPELLPSDHGKADEERSGGAQTGNEPGSAKPELAGREEGVVQAASSSREPKIKGLRQRGTSWAAERTVQRRSVHLGQFRTREEALAKLAEADRLIAEGRHPKTGEPLPEPATELPALEEMREATSPTSEAFDRSLTKEPVTVHIRGDIPAAVVANMAERIREAVEAATNEPEPLPAPTDLYCDPEPAPFAQRYFVDAPSAERVYGEAALIDRWPTEERSDLDDTLEGRSLRRPRVVDVAAEPHGGGDVDRSLPAGGAQAPSVHETLRRAAGALPALVTATDVEEPRVKDGRVIYVDRREATIETDTKRVWVDRKLVPVFEALSDGRMRPVTDLAKLAGLSVPDFKSKVPGARRWCSEVGLRFDDSTRHFVKLSAL
jgi:hypothetical protein